ncbi:UDP-phosphate galactose phosphotransferase [Erysipelothrix larvae]|uniref:UDP-phosphate galactose phosphotransferase n=1 Tax=Erysipelothrix larvae TaxID=1514105 RepID=A0A0X8H0Z5_9FIRM|nr:sugar transferase [Erysipelothrix larvae]AMC94057.1 UDP-phosphate galactose phosphotransferase [Erysipelothrix larvae]
MYQEYFKRIFDLLLAIIAFPMFLVIVVVIVPLIYFEDKGTLFYNAPRLGKNGKSFNMYKFRSMKMNAPDIRNFDGSTYNAKDDQRLTKIGRFIRKTSLDETPQLLNVFKGDMSIIGPRPDLIEHRSLYEGNEYRKLEVRPGITGYSQAYFRNAIPWKDRIKKDIYYIDHLTLWMDVKVLLKTVVLIIKREKVYGEQKSDNVKDEKANDS